MNTGNFDNFLEQIVKTDKSHVRLCDDSFASFSKNMERQQVAAARQKKIINYAVVPVVLLTIVLNILFLFNSNQSQDFQSIDTFAEENHISTSAYYFSEVLINE